MNRFASYLFSFFIAIALTFFIDNAKGQVTLHTINVKNTDELIDFFKYRNIRSPLISAHRGGARAGFPENCIATFENTLIYTPSIFEVDPHLTKDSIVVLIHDETLDRTTTGKGKVIDYTWEELKDLKLKDNNGNVTPYRIPLLEDALEWCKGKTILVLDDKDVPYKMVYELVNKHRAFSNILMTVHTAKIAKQFYDFDRRFVFEAFVFDMEDIAEFEAEGIPWSHVMAYTGPTDSPDRMNFYKELNRRGVKAMVSGAPSLDGKFLEGDDSVYQQIFIHGADIIETNLPIQTAVQVQYLFNSDCHMNKYIGKTEIPLKEIRYLP